MFCAAFRRFVVCGKRFSAYHGVWPFVFGIGKELVAFQRKRTRFNFGLSTNSNFSTCVQFISLGNMSPRGKAKAKKDTDVGANGKEKRVRESRNVKAASYKDLSDSDDEKPKRKVRKDSDSESPFEDEKPKRRSGTGKRGRPRSRKDDVSDSEEASDFACSDESSGEESSKRRKSSRKPPRSLRLQRGTSYKDLSNSEEDSAADSGSASEDDDEDNAVKPKKGKPAAKSSQKPKKEELSASGSENEDGEEDKPRKKDAADTSNDSKSKVKDEEGSDDESSEKNDSKSKPKRAESEEEGSEEDEDEGKKEKLKVKDVKNEGNDTKKRIHTGKNSEVVSEDEEAVGKPPAKKAKVEDKPKLNRTDSDYDSIDFSSNAKTKEGNPWNFKISSWNVAGLKAWIKKNGLEFIKYEKPDILCLQEIKCSEKKLPPEMKVDGYHAYWLSGEKEGYAGVAVLSKEKPLNVSYGLEKPEFDSEGRVITAEYEKFYLVNVYVPNAGQGLKTLPRRLEWDPLFRAHLKKLDEQKPVILCGDLNVAHNEIDLTNPKTNSKSAGFTPQEREGMTALLKEGFVDTFRNLYPDKTNAYSFWSYFNSARSRNIGWRLDYFITSERFLPNICDNVMRNEVYGSDHCPITLFAHV